MASLIVRKAREIQKQQEELEQKQQEAEKSSKKKWVLPVVIVGSLAVIGTIVFLVIKKRNQ
jgi:hypothetical protein